MDVAEMKNKAKWKGILIAVAVFLTGVVTGSVNSVGISRHIAKQNLSLDHLHDKLMGILIKKLDLSPDQVDQISPMILKGCERYGQLTLNTFNEVNELVGQINKEISTLLDPIQRTQLEELERGRQEEALRKIDSYKFLQLGVDIQEP